MSDERGSAKGVAIMKAGFGRAAGRAVPFLRYAIPQPAVSQHGLAVTAQ